MALVSGGSAHSNQHVNVLLLFTCSTKQVSMDHFKSNIIAACALHISYRKCVLDQVKGILSLSFQCTVNVVVLIQLASF